jgi:hypothetical protein
VTKLPTFDLKRAWEAGVPLSQAPVAFARAEDRAALLKYRERAGHWQLNAVKNMIAEATKRLDVLEPGERITYEERQHHEDLERRMRDNVLRWLSQEQLLAVGYSHPRQPDDIPRSIPPELFSLLFFRFDSNRIEGNGLRFDVVRVVRTAALFGDKESTPIVEKKRGRPTAQPVILAAYKASKEAGLIDFSGKKKDAVKCVQQWLRKHKPLDYQTGKGFGPKAIEIAISEDFDREKAARKKE